MQTDSANQKTLEDNVNNFFKSNSTVSQEPIKTVHFSVDDSKKDNQAKKLSTPNLHQNNLNDRRSASKPRTAYKKPTQEYIGRDNKVDSDIYFKVKDENDHLKKHQLQLNEYIKKLNANLEKVKHEVLMERKLSDRKVIHMDGGFDVEVETLKMENDKLQDKLKKMQTIVKGLQSQSVQNAGRSLGRKNLINAKTTLENQNEKNEYLSIINHLRDQLKQSDNEVKRLSAELNTPNKAIKNMTEFNKDLRERNSQLSEIQMKYDKIQMQYDTNVKLMQHTQQSLEEYISKYNEERKKNLDLENRIQLMESNLAKMPEYVSLIEDYKLKEKHLEDRIKDLCENPFIKQAEERGNVYRKLQESELSLNEATRRLKNFEENNKSLEKENKSLKEQFQIACIDRDNYKEEAMRYRISNEEREKQARNFEDQFKLLGQYGEVDSNFTKILNILKLRDDNTSWMKIDFLDKMNEPQSQDPTFLMKEIERLKIEKGILGSELEKTKSLLQIQQQINEDHVKLAEEDKKILKMQNEKLIKKCEELAKLIDIERLPYKSRDIMGIRNADDLRRELLSGVLPEDRAVNLMSDAITEFSKDETETEFGLNDNALDLYIGEAFFEEGLERELGFRLANIMSFLSVDFYMHETETSNLISGARPIYNFQLSFKVVVDEHLIHYLESDFIMLDIYYIKDNVQALLGKGKIPLQELINVENPKSNQGGSLPTSRVINGVCQLFYSKDENLLIGSLHYKMRMRQPLLEVVKWYKERNQLIREISPVQDVMMKKVEKELVSVNNFGKGKVMAVTILLTKATGLKVPGAPRKITPYVYYQFYKFDEHFTQTAIGGDPMFQDVVKYDIVYDNSFHDYIEKETINFYVLDNSRPLEVEMKQEENRTNSVNLIDNPEYEDLIGICKVPLKDLLINDLIQNSFPIHNLKGQVSGELVLNIFWEQVALEDEHSASGKNQLPYETKTWEDALVVRLADLLKHKGLNLNSAFEIFDRDNKQMISLVNFKDTILWTFKYTSNQHELEELTELIFKGRTTLTKLDFYKIFALHLPHEGPMEDLHQVEKQKAIQMVKKIEENQIVENVSINLGPDPKRAQSEEGLNNTNNNLLSNSNDKLGASLRNQTTTQGKVNFVNSTTPNLIPDSNRSMKDLVARLNEYMAKTGKSTPLEIYKMFDRDADLKVGKNVII